MKIVAEIHNAEYAKNLVKTKRKNIMGKLMEWIDEQIINHANRGHDSIRVTHTVVMGMFDVSPSKEMFQDIADYLETVGGYRAEVMKNNKGVLCLDIHWD